MKRSARDVPKKHHRVRSILLGIVFVFSIWFIFQCIGQLRTSIFFSNQHRFSLALRTNPLLVLSFGEPDEPNLLVTIPETISVRVPEGYGLYRMGSVWGLGELEKKPELFTESMSDLLGIPIHGWISGPNSITLENTSDGLLATVKSLFSPLSLFRDYTRTNLNTLDRILLSYKLLRLKSQTTRIYPVHTSQFIFVPVELPDGTRGQAVNELALDEFLEQKFEYSKVREEGLILKVFNTTDTPGVGNKLARFITNRGGKVISVENRDREVAVCEVVVEEKHARAKIVTFLQQEFDCTLSFQETLDADVLVFVGDSFGKRWK